MPDLSGAAVTAARDAVRPFAADIADAILRVGKRDPDAVARVIGDGLVRAFCDGWDAAAPALAKAERARLLALATQRQAAAAERSEFYPLGIIADLLDGDDDGR